MVKHYIIKEYESFYCDKENTNKVNNGCKPLPKKTFDALENFILTNKTTMDVDVLELMSISAKRGAGKVISAKNHVGVIAMKDGTTIEILPKIYSEYDDNTESTKKVLLDMLKSLRNSPYKSFQVSNIHVERMTIYEVFIKMFIDEVFFIVKRGLKCDYQTILNNETFFKGKINISGHIKRNFIHKERVFIEYDLFNCNRAENRLIKATLMFLKSTSTSMKNKTDINTLLNVFDEVDSSTNYEQDFAKYISDRNMKEYDTVMKWCKVFLTNKSFTCFAGNEIAFSLLFSMELLFESYVAQQLSRAIDKKQYSISAQDKSFHLFDSPQKKFMMKPDIVVRQSLTNLVTVMDTKWKILSSAYNNYGISQADMYQMYAYNKKYAAKEVLLLYPFNSYVTQSEIIQFKSVDGVNVRVLFVDLLNMAESIRDILEVVG